MSNTNALEVQGLQDVNATNMLDEGLHGQVLGHSGQTLDSLIVSEAFKPTQGWNLFRRPATLVRKETLQMAKYIDQAGSKSQTLRKIIHGEKGSGKSVLALQAMSMAFLKGWIVIHIPEGQSFALLSIPSLHN